MRLTCLCTGASTPTCLVPPLLRHASRWWESRARPWRSADSVTGRRGDAPDWKRPETATRTPVSTRRRDDIRDSTNKGFLEQPSGTQDHAERTTPGGEAEHPAEAAADGQEDHRTVILPPVMSQPQHGSLQGGLLGVPTGSAPIVEAQVALAEVRLLTSRCSPEPPHRPSSPG